MKKRNYGIIFLVIIILFCTPNIAEAENKKVKEIKVSLSTDDAFTVDRILYEVFLRNGYEATFTSTEMTSSLRAVNDGEYDVHSDQTIGFDKDYENIIRVPVKVAEISFYVYARSDQGINKSVNSWEDLEGLSIGKEFQRPYIEKALKNLKNISITSFNTKSQLLESLANGEIDVAVIPQRNEHMVYIPSGIERIGITETEDTYLYMNKAHKDLIPVIVSTYQEMENTGEIEEIRNGRSTPTNGKRLILHLMSYNMENKSEENLNKGIRESLMEDEDTQLYTLTLNSNLQENHEDRLKMVSEMLRSNFGIRHPDLIIISNNYALEYMKENYFRMFNGTPMIYVGVQDEDVSGFWENFIYIDKNIEMKEIVDEALHLFPDTKQLFVINDMLKEGISSKKSMEYQLQEYQDQLKIEYSDDISFDELLNKIRDLPEDAVIISGTYYGGESVQYYTGAEIQQLFEKAYKNPVFSNNITGLFEGELGGKYIETNKIGKYVGEIAISVAKGKNINEIELDASRLQNAWYYDYDMMQKWKIDKKDVHKDATIYNMRSTFRELNPIAYNLLLLFIVTFTAAFFILLYMILQARKRNKELLFTQKNLVKAEEVIIRDKELIQVKEKLETIIGTAPLSYVVIKEDGTIEEVNNYSKDKLGMAISDNILECYDDKKKGRKVIDKMIHFGKIIGEVVEYKMIFGEVNRFYLNATAIDDGNQTKYIGWASNIEELEKQKDAFRKTQKDLNKLIDSFPWPMCVLEQSTHELVYINEAYVEYFGDILILEGNGFWNLFPDFQPNGEDSHTFMKDVFMDIIHSEGIVIYEVEHLLPDDRVITMKGYGTEITYNKNKAMSIILQDISLEKQQEEILRNSALKEKEANQLKSKFIVNMSHEIRTPMNAIIGLSNIELNKPHKEEVLEPFHKINHAAEILLAIINDILDFSNIEAEEIEIEKMDFELEDMLSKILNTTSQRLIDKKVELLVDIGHDIPKSVFGDCKRLRQILKNVLENAAKFTNQGKIVFKIGLGEDLGNIKEFIFTIEDSGRGIQTKDLERIFIPFEQLNEKSIKSDGTGLGLSITKKLTELMGGTINIMSRENKGTTVVITLPIKILNENEKIVEKSYSSVLKDKRILIVDDCEIACKIMMNLLNHVKAKVTVQMKADEVIPHIQEMNRLGKQYDIILMDYLLDKGTGLDIGKVIKNICGETVKIIIVSAYAKFHIEEFDKNKIITDMIDKPFVPSVFYKTLQNAIEGMTKDNSLNDNYHFPNAKVLICEDNLINQEVIRGILELYSIDPVIAGDGLEGIDMLEKERFDLVIMDILMPNMNGHEATIQIRNSNTAYNKVPIVAMTANAMMEERDVCFKEGMNGYITKPVDIALLYRELLNWLPSEIIKDDSAQETAESELQMMTTDEEERQLIDLGVDFNSGVERFGGKSDVYKKTLKNLVTETLKDGLLAYEEMIKEDKLEEFKRYIHSLKGVTGNLSMINVNNILIEFEETLKSGHPNPRLYQDFVDTFYEQATAIEKILTVKDEVHLELGGKEECSQLFHQLMEYLKQGNAKKCENIVNYLQQKTWEYYDFEGIDRIIKTVEDYDYLKAIEYIEKIL